MKRSLLGLSLLLAGLQTSQAVILLSENFDGGAVNSSFAYTSTSGTAPSTQNVGGTHGNVARLTNNDASNNNSIAFNAVNIPATPVLRLTFDFFMSAGEGTAAADGIGIGFFPAATTGGSGGFNPATGGAGGDWERFNFPAGSGALGIGMRIYDANHLHLNFNGTEIITGVASFTLNTAQWHRAIFTITDQGASSVADLNFITDVNGAAIPAAGFTNQALTGVNLDTLASTYRLIAGGRTGGAFVTAELDNINLEAVPEPSLTILTSLAAAGFGLRRRRSA